MQAAWSVERVFTITLLVLPLMEMMSGMHVGCGRQLVPVACRLN
jgi:hypothetical protein